MKPANDRLRLVRAPDRPSVKGATLSPPACAAASTPIATRRACRTITIPPGAEYDGLAGIAEKNGLRIVRDPEFTERNPGLLTNAPKSVLKVSASMRSTHADTSDSRDTSIARDCIALITAAEHRLAHRHDEYLDRRRTREIREMHQEETAR